VDPAQPFSDAPHIILVNPYGCAARCPREVKIGAAVDLEGLPVWSHVTARVVTCSSLGKDQESWLLGLALDEPGNVWGIKIPPQDWTTSERVP
jgi:hypothetical protein